MTENQKKKKDDENLTLLLKQVGEKTGLTLEEMRRRYEEFLSQTARPSITDEELSRRTAEFLEAISKGKRKKPKTALKVTVTLNDDEATKFYTIKQTFSVKSNAAVLRKLLNSYEVC